MPRAAAKTTDPNLYDGAAVQRIPFQVTEGSEKFETAHQVRGLGDELFLSAIDAADEAAEDPNEAYAHAAHSIWRDLVTKVENTDAGDADFRDLIDAKEAIAVSTGLMSVMVVPPAAVSQGVRDLKGTVTFKTHAFVSGQLLEQTHELRRKTDENRKQFDLAIQGDKPSGRAKAKAAIYDSILVRSTGFKGKTPIRFKTTVIDDYFGRTKIDPKK